MSHCTSLSTVGFIRAGRYLVMVDASMLPELTTRRWKVIGSKWHKYAYNSHDRVLMHRVILNAPQGMEVDHINGNKLINTTWNLRLATHNQNAQNRIHAKRSKHWYRGVAYVASNKRFCARIRHNGKLHNSPCIYDTPLEAAREYDRMAKLLHGEFASLNFPDD